MDERIYEAVKSYKQTTNEWDNLSQEDQRFIDFTITEYERGGIGLPDEQRMKIDVIAKEMRNITASFFQAG